jgi:p-hydroxybenzoate 3-monooxygenase
MRTHVGIIGAGPAGLLLARLLHRAGIDTVVLESRSREYVLGRVRAGVLEQGTVDTMDEAGCGARLHQDGLLHDGIVLRFDGADHTVPITALTGKHVTVYGQQEVVRDLIAAREADGAPILWEAQAEAIDAEAGTITFTREGERQTLACDYIAGCDGFHGVARAAIPEDVLRIYERVYPFAWLGILAEAPPALHLVSYAHHERGFALSSMRSPTISRLYIQCEPDEDLSLWPDERVWDELDLRLTGHTGGLQRGPVLQKGITPMRSFVAEPMQYGRLFIAGDAAHIVPPTGAKGMNLAVSDVRVLAAALRAHYREGSDTLLQAYSATCLDRIWKVTRFSWWVTSTMHRFPAADEFDTRLQLAQLRHLVASRDAAADFAGNYVGLPLPI